MFALLTNPLLIVLGLVAGCCCFLWSARSWVAGIYLLTTAMMFGGIIALRIGSGGGALAVAFRDTFIVCPLYIAFYCSRAGVEALKRVPLEFLAALFVISFYLFVLALFNSGSSPILQTLIGLKVWLFYIPLLPIGIALAARPEALVGFLRFFLVIGIVPVGIGLLQVLLTQLMGYDAAIGLFYGSSAYDVTQGFGFIEDAGNIHRIPGTFSFAAQYGEYLFLYLTVAAIEANIEVDTRVRNFAIAAVYIGMLAGILSGSKGSLVTYTAMLGAFAGVGLISWRVLLLAPVGILVAIWAIASAGVNAGDLLASGLFYTGDYYNNFIFQQISDAMQYGAFGAGIGTSTGGARYATTGLVEGLNSMLGYESYYAKIIAELGWMGMVIFMPFLICIVLRVAASFLKCFSRPQHNLVAPCAIYLSLNLVMSFKGFVLDTDPANIFFWLTLGIMLEISSIAGTRSGAVSEIPELVPAE